MKTIQELEYEARAILDRAKEENREMTGDETRRFDELMAEMDQIRGNKALEARLNSGELTYHKADDGGYRSLGEFIHSVADAMVWHTKPFDNRLNELRGMSMGEGTGGGYIVPTQFRPELMQIGLQEGIVRPRAFIIPAGTPPDAKIELPVLDQSSSMTGGIELSWVGEGATKPETEAELKPFSLIPHELSGYVTVTDQLLRNWESAEVVISSMLKNGLIVGEDTAFLTGSGVARPHGILSQNARILQTRNASGSVSWADVRDMFWKCLKRGPNGSTPVWIISPSVLPKIMDICDPGNAGTMIWQPSAREGEPSRLLGLPILINERSPALGNQGDVMLCNLGYYTIKDGSGPFIAASPHVEFKSNRTIIKIFHNVDGDSWLQNKVPIEGDPNNFLSPFVILDE